MYTIARRMAAASVAGALSLALVSGTAFAQDANAGAANQATNQDGTPR